MGGAWVGRWAGGWVVWVRVDWKGVEGGSQSSQTPKIVASFSRAVQGRVWVDGWVWVGGMGGGGGGGHTVDTQEKEGGRTRTKNKQTNKQPYILFDSIFC